ncbi:Imm9 family immunity protein [Ventosimonas gracilis]|nr:Imm9 family immunity protein [Ventosimonas gracilis]
MESNFIGIHKKFLRHPLGREYEMMISPPIPDNRQAPYGIPPLGKKIKAFRPIKNVRFHALDPEFHKYDNLEQCILASAIKAIDFGFTKGFACYGKKIKFQDL